MKEPKIDKSVWVANDADIFGDVTIGKDSSVWYKSVIRGDNDVITIGERTNIQDCAILHNDKKYPITIGNDVTIGHAAIIHGCTIGDNCVIGMGSIILNGAVIGKNSIVGAGAIVTQGKVMPEGSLIIGAPGKVVRALTEEEIKDNLDTAKEYVEEANMHREYHLKK